MNSLPPLNALRAFDLSGRRLNFRAAAEDLGVTQGAVAQQVRNLEAHIGVPLFERLPKGLAFTPAGRAYHRQVSAGFETLREATAVLRPESGRVLVSVTPTFAAKFLIPNLPTFTEANPGIDLRVLATEQMSSFHADSIDLAVRHGQPPFGATLEAVRLFRQEIVAVAAPGLSGSSGEPVPLDALAGLSKLHDAHDLWPEFSARLGIRDQSGRGLRFSQTSLAIDAAVSGQGVALVARFLVAQDLAAGRLVEVSNATLQAPQDFYLLAEKRVKRSAAVQAVWEWFLSMAEPEER